MSLCSNIYVSLFRSFSLSFFLQAALKCSTFSLFFAELLSGALLSILGCSEALKNLNYVGCLWLWLGKNIIEKNSKFKVIFLNLPWHTLLSALIVIILNTLVTGPITEPNLALMASAELDPSCRIFLFLFHQRSSQTECFLWGFLLLFLPHVSKILKCVSFIHNAQSYRLIYFVVDWNVYSLRSPSYLQTTSPDQHFKSINSFFTILFHCPCFRCG